ncbi:hypothetical protein IC006_0128 [Sulfuracidifex tepidarius]|uniref:DUF2079 domain-containing protein n=1 Tax=Sulfuracidifex tepidarius TaxID=1294262 RepID=A0A510DRR4_9CREN|nr:DUF2079 domain-containing protein [Sulfuracidifex tepidarius]BBG22844.1 hypothetical protein IC006_0128 [Sulfuracidifex tepidarius]
MKIEKAKYVIPSTFYVVWALAFLRVIPDSYFALAPASIVTVSSAAFLLVRKIIRVVKYEWKLLAVSLTISSFMILWMYLKYLSYETYAFDLGIFEQSLYTTAFSHRWFLDNPDMVTFYGSHPQGYVSLWNILFSPFMLLLLPLYALFPSPLTLFTVEALVVTTASVPLKKLVEVLNPRASRVVPYVYLGYPFLYLSSFYDFHLESFIPFFTFITLYFYLTMRWRYMWPLLVTYFTIIKVTPVLFLFSIPFLYRETREKIVALISGAGALLYLGFSTLMEKVPYDGKLYLVKNALTTTSFHYFGLRYNLFHVLYNIPLESMYLLFLLAPLLLLPLSKPLQMLPAWVWLAYSWFSLYVPYYNDLYQYNFIVIPFLFIAFSVSNINININSFKLSLVISFLVISSIAALTSVYGYDRGIASLEIPHIDQKIASINEVVSHMSGVIVASNSIFPHLANSMYTFCEAPPNVTPNYVFDCIYFHSNQINHYIKNGYHVIAEIPPYVALSRTEQSVLAFLPFNASFFVYPNNNQSFTVEPGVYNISFSRPFTGYVEGTELINATQALIEVNSSCLNISSYSFTYVTINEEFI